MMLLQELAQETARSWAQIELAGDLALTDDAAAFQMIEALPSANQRDRGLAHLAHRSSHGRQRRRCTGGG
jgi:hypothetical protein